MANKALFLDRDGVINVDHGYAYQASQIEFIDEVFTLCQRFINAGYLLIVVTNQSGIARGFYSESQFLTLTDWIEQQFAQRGLPITHTYYCPHHPTAGQGPYTKMCECRKPAAGMLLQAIEQYDIDARQSLLVGDKVSDMQAAQRAGIRHCYLYANKPPASADAANQMQVVSRLTDIPLPKITD